MYIADLHIHSKFSRATSPSGDIPHLDLWARRKGIGLVGTGDFTHPAWREHLAQTLLPAEEGFYVVRDDMRLSEVLAAPAPRFVLSGEISCIYKQDGRVRKVHNVILLPSLDAAERLSLKLEAVGNIHSDGRPILGLSSRDLLAVTLDVCPDAIFIPAHIWTPHFSLLGAFSGFDSVSECFGDLSGHIRALETGLSSDPLMNRRVPLLDGYTMVSNSDAHSPAKLGRECNVLDGPLSYPALKKALDTGEGFCGTIEFFPEEGKYHLDGHRNCRLKLTPEETAAYGGRCPVCGKKITIGVLNRVEQLAARPEGFTPTDAKPFEHLMPLPEVIAASLGISEANEKTVRLYEKLLRELGPEMEILRERTFDDIRRTGGEFLAEGIRRLRQGKVSKSAGFDGEYGKISLFSPDELKSAAGQLSFLCDADIPAAPFRPTAAPAAGVAPAQQPASTAKGLNDRQSAAADSAATVTAVVAGPGTGKTFTLVERIARLVEKGVAADTITAVTFTVKAAGEMRSRLAVRLGERARCVNIGTFHSLCLELLKDTVRLADQTALFGLAARITKEYGVSMSPRSFLNLVSAAKNGLPADCTAAIQAYNAALKEQGLCDFDDLIAEALGRDLFDKRFTHLHVDEFQDVNGAQYRLVEQWLSHGKSLFVIGDPDQAIYGFRGAAADCFDRLAADWPNAHFIRLTQCYRSTPQIVRCAQTVISYNPEGTKVGRLLTATRPSGASVRLIECASDMSEGIFVAKEIARLTGGLTMLDAKVREKPHTFDEIAVLARTHRQLSRIESCLRHEGVPCLAVGRSDFLDAPVVRGTLAFFRAVSGDRSAVDEASSFLDGQTAYEHAAQLFLTKLSDRPRKILADWRAYIRTEAAAYEQLMEAAHYPDMPSFLHALLLGGEGDVSRETGDVHSGAVYLSTLHGAKGLEFPVVFVCGLSEGLLPVPDADLQEERRLLYVGLTRAADELIISSFGKPSPFIGQLPNWIKREQAFKKPRAEQLTMF